MPSQNKINSCIKGKFASTHRRNEMKESALWSCVCGVEQNTRRISLVNQKLLFTTKAPIKINIHIERAREAVGTAFGAVCCQHYT